VEDTAVMLSDQSIIVAHERYADLLRVAEHERQLNTLRPPHGQQSSRGVLGPSRWGQSLDRLRAVTGMRPPPLASCVE
jgi:hypothetical protein